MFEALRCGGARYEFQCQFGSIGWAVGATLGYSIGLGPKKRLIASIGDGSFQVRTVPSHRLAPIPYQINLITISYQSIP